MARRARTHVGAARAHAARARERWRGAHIRRALIRSLQKARLRPESTSTYVPHKTDFRTPRPSRSYQLAFKRQRRRFISLSALVEARVRMTSRALSGLASIAVVLAAVPADRVTTLPGFGTPVTALYSGYLDAGNGKHHHYVYSEASLPLFEPRETAERAYSSNAPAPPPPLSRGTTRRRTISSSGLMADRDVRRSRAASARAAPTASRSLRTRPRSRRTLGPGTTSRTISSSRARPASASATATRLTAASTTTTARRPTISRPLSASSRRTRSCRRRDFSSRARAMPESTSPC